VRAILPENHLNPDTKDAVKVGMGLVATMAALVLGLLVASTKGAYDAQKGEVTQMAAKIVFLDRVLANYGSETAETRDLLRRSVGSASDLNPGIGYAVRRCNPDLLRAHAQRVKSSRPLNPKMIELANKDRRIVKLSFRRTLFHADVSN
jgi:hypothetical protein